jgi:hypothetical protein
MERKCDVNVAMVCHRGEEMVMPAERVGPVREAYLWRVLQRRGAAPAPARYVHAPPRHPHHARLFAVACPPAVRHAYRYIALGLHCNHSAKVQFDCITIVAEFGLHYDCTPLQNCNLTESLPL